MHNINQLNTVLSVASFIHHTQFVYDGNNYEIQVFWASFTSPINHKAFSLAIWQRYSCLLLPLTLIQHYSKCCTLSAETAKGLAEAYSHLTRKTYFLILLYTFAGLLLYIPQP